MRHALPLLLACLTLPARGQEEPAGDPPAGFVEAPPPGAKQAYFMRLEAVTLGGNFDSADAEEVQVRAMIGQREVPLARRVLDLPSEEVERFEVEGAAWVELPPPPLELELEARDEDLTEWESITTTDRPLKLDVAAFGAQPKARVVETTTIRLEEWGFLRPKRRVVIEGPSLEVALVAAPRRDARDAESAALARGAFAAALEAPADVTPAGAVLLSRQLAAAQASALARAGASLHTYARRRLPALASTAGALADDARRLAAADAPTLRERLRSLRGGAAALDRLLDEVDRGLGEAAPDDDRLAAWEARVDSMAGELIGESMRAVESGDALKDALRDARAGLRLTAADVDARWKALRRELEAELAP